MQVSTNGTISCCFVCGWKEGDYTKSKSQRLKRCATGVVIEQQNHMKSCPRDTLDSNLLCSVCFTGNSDCVKAVGHAVVQYEQGKANLRQNAGTRHALLAQHVKAVCKRADPGLGPEMLQRCKERYLQAEVSKEAARADKRKCTNSPNKR